MRIGYSFWGFLGPGITDTPDGGRSHRRTLIDGLTAAGHDIVFVQHNRDLAEAGHDLRHRYAWDDGLPDIDVLFLEWRWPIPGRNTTRCGTPGHTCDLHRQDELVARYTLGHRVPTLCGTKTCNCRHVPRCARCPTSRSARLRWRPAPARSACCSPSPTTTWTGPIRRPWPRCPGRCRWSTSGTSTTATRRSRRSSHPPLPGTAIAWPGSGADGGLAERHFTGRCAFPEVRKLYESALTTVVLLPERYARAGQMTQRLFEAVLAGCLPVTPAALPFASAFTPPALHAATGTQAADRITELQKIAGTARHAELIADCLGRLGLFRLSRQLTTVNQSFGGSPMRFPRVRTPGRGPLGS